LLVNQQESERAKDPFKLVEVKDPTELVGVLAQIKGSVVFRLSCSPRGPIQTRNEEHMVFMNDVCEKMEVGIGSHIASTKQVCENKQLSVEVHSVGWPPSERDV
jgi:hypothetical protein